MHAPVGRLLPLRQQAAPPARRRRTRAGLAAVAVATVTVSCTVLPGTSRERSAQTGEGRTMPTAEQTLRYGFRHDPMEFVAKAQSPVAAQLRAQGFGTPGGGDAALLEGCWAEALKGQRPDGSFGDTANETGGRLDRLAEAGFPLTRPEFRRAVEAVLRQAAAEAVTDTSEARRKRGVALLPVNGLRALCRPGVVDPAVLRPSLRWFADHPQAWLEDTCPWGATFVLRALWYARAVEPVDDGLREALAWVGRNLNAAGGVRYWDPYAVVAALGTIETPEARALLLRQVPMILRGQDADGGWGGGPEGSPTLAVFGALRTHGLLNELRRLPPPPPDWEVVRSLPAPQGKLGRLVWLNGRFWVHSRDTGELLALSPTDGAVVQRLTVPGVRPGSIGAWGQSLAVMPEGAKKVLKVNPETGRIELEIPVEFMEAPTCAIEVDGRLWVADDYVFPGNVVDPAVPATWQGADAKAEGRRRLETLLAGTCTNAMARAADGVWHHDIFTHALIESGPDGKLRDWGERPFGWVTGLAWDGQYLWTLDPAHGRLCAIRKAAAPGR